MFLKMFNTPKLEVLRIMRKYSKIGVFASIAKTPKSEVLRIKLLKYLISCFILQYQCFQNH